MLVDTLPRLARPFAILRQTCDERVRGDQTLRTLALVVLAYATLLVAAWGVCSLLWSITLKAQVGTTLDSQEYVRAVTRRHWWGQQADPKPKGAFFLQKMIGRGMFVETLVGMRDFTCPLLSMIMLDPVTACDGCTYERAAIEIWFERKLVSPVTGLALQHQQLTPNTGLRRRIEAGALALKAAVHAATGRHPDDSGSD